MALDSQFIDALNSMIQATSALWVAGATPLTQLTLEEQQRRLGYSPEPGEPSHEERQNLVFDQHQQWLSQLDAEKVSVHPRKFDWRSVNGHNYVSPVKTQGDCGCCVAFGVAAAMNLRLRVTVDMGFDDANSHQFKDLSEAQLAFCGGRSNVCTTGWHPRAALDYCQQQGLAPEDTFPYTDHDQTCSLSTDWQTKLTRIQSWQELYNVDEAKRLLSREPGDGVAGGGLVAGFTVFQDFFAYKSGVYTQQTGARVGEHVVCVIGYDDDKQAWLAKNSWGPEWGDAGFFWIAYGQCGFGWPMWVIDSFSSYYRQRP